MSAIYAATMVAQGPSKLFKITEEPDKLLLVNGWVSAASVRVALSGGFEQEITNLANLWFEFVIEPGGELWVQGTGDYKFIVCRHPHVWLMQFAENLLNPKEPRRWCQPVTR